MIKTIVGNLTSRKVNTLVAISLRRDKSTTPFTFSETNLKDLSTSHAKASCNGLNKATKHTAVHHNKWSALPNR